MKYYPLLLMLIALATVSCKTSQQVATTTTPPTPSLVIENNIEEAPVYAPKTYGYKPSETRYHDLLHTRLELSFDWENRQANGKANLRLRPYFYATTEIVLDAKGFDIHQVQWVEESGNKDLKYTYDGNKLSIDLGRKLTRDDEFELFIDYTAKPYSRESNGGTAITSDLGLYFVNHDGADPEKPKQIWTQGETEASSCWFPTIDATNERCTQEIYLTVDKKYVTVSNGALVDQTEHDNGTRTDYWKQDKPHSPYLFALAIGEFAEIKDTWREKAVNYYVEPEYEPYAQLVFGNTPEMMEFFSTQLNYDYPWDKYHQIVVREFVSGAMENTGCVIFYDQLQHDGREHLDETNEDIVAHELFHHWFGDLVTCESWANLPLNESFASYGESLWFGHKYGKDYADHHLDKDLSLYLDESAEKQEPLIRYELKKPDDMFDRHSYQKGARVLHMLKNHIGEEAFWKSLERYLKSNEYSDVEIHELRMAFEDETGQDLNWFFNQWFLSAGHPVLNVGYEAGKNTVSVNVSQIQDLRYFPVFRLPLTVRITDSKGKATDFPVEMISQDTVFQLSYKGDVGNVVFDADRILVGEMTETKPMAWWVNQALYANNYKQEQEAIEELADYLDQDDAVDALLARLKDSWWATRQEALLVLQQYEGVRQRALYTTFLDLAQNDPRSDVRSEALGTFTNEAVFAFMDEKGLMGEVDKAIESGLKDSSYTVQATALAALTYRDGMRAYGLARKMETGRSSQILMITNLIMMQVGQPEDFERVLTNVKKMRTGQEKLQILQVMGGYLKKQSPENQSQGIQYLMEIAEHEEQWALRYGAAQSIGAFADQEGVQTFIKERVASEKNKQVKSLYQNMLKG